MATGVEDLVWAGFPNGDIPWRAISPDRKLEFGLGETPLPEARNRPQGWPSLAWVPGGAQDDRGRYQGGTILSHSP